MLVQQILVYLTKPVYKGILLQAVHVIVDTTQFTGLETCAVCKICMLYVASHDYECLQAFIIMRGHVYSPKTLVIYTLMLHGTTHLSLPHKACL